MSAIRASSLALAVLAAGFLSAVSPSLADMVTAKVESWDPETKILTLDSGEEFNLEAVQFEIPEGIEEGVSVTIDYSSNDNGVTSVASLIVNP